ncbi:MAG: DUF4345 family protein [Pseudomonadota bacterium]
MTFNFPQNAHDFLVMLVPMLTFALGFAFLFFPGRLLRFMGLEPIGGKPEAIGEGRSSFAGALLALALGCLLLQDPIALQPGLNLMLAIGWSISTFGRLLQLTFDGGLKRKRIQTRFLIAFGLAVMAWSVTEIPYMSCVENAASECTLPGSLKDWFLFLVAILTFGLGLIALLLPRLALRILKLQTRINMPYAVGETRGTLAGFYMAIGGVYLLMPQPVDFVALVLGGAWLLTGLGRALSVLFDRGWTVYNMFGVLFEVGIGVLTIGFVLRLY